MKGLLTLLVCLSIAVAANAQDIVINELIYDDTGGDDACWLEIKGPPGLPLDTFRLIGINGNGGGEYNEILLAGYSIPPDGYFLIAQNAGMGEDMVDSNVNFQNGDDSVQLQEDVGEPPTPVWIIVDAVGYGDFDGGEVFGGEGTPAPDVSGDLTSLARCPDGNDTNDNGADFIADPNPTPGAMNMGDCYPATGACCFIDGSCVPDLEEVDCTAAGGSLWLEGVPCEPDNPCPVQEPTDYDACELSEVDPVTGRPVHEGEWVRMTGIVLNESWLWAGYRTEFSITDDSGCCFNVYDGSQALSFVRGDEVEVIGTVGFYNGKAQITTPDLTINLLTSGNPLPTPAVVPTGTLGEVHESCLIKFECVTIIDGTWPDEGDNANITVDDGSGPATVRIDRDTEVDGTPAPVGEFSVFGIASQYDSSDPYFDGYQMLPRDPGDIDYDDCGIWGACCFGDGSCQVMEEQACLDAGGVDFIPGEDCEPNPCVPIIGACCFEDYTCQELLESECSAMGGAYWLPEVPCDPNPCAPTDMTICEAAATDPGTGLPLNEGEWIRVTGVALMESYLWSDSRTEFTLTDDSGCCIDVYSYNPIGFDVVRGDMVEVIGTVDFYRGKTQISTPDLVVTILSQGNPLPAPEEISTYELDTNGEQYESCLIKLTCVTIVEGTWPPEGDDANLSVDDGTGPATMRIDRDTEIDGSTAPVGEFSAIGIGGQYDSSEPYLTGYQMLPRDLNDILYDDCLPPIGACCFSDGSCQDLYEDECTQLGGDPWYEGVPCEPNNPCPPPPPLGACCYGDHLCTVIEEDGCWQIEGAYLWIEGEVCEPNPCPPTATETSSWGKIKANFK